MINKTQLARLTRDVLQGMDMYSPAAFNLVLGTIAQESRGGTYIEQLGNGPALGIGQMEPATEKDIWENYLYYRADIIKKIQQVSGVVGPGPHLRYNLAYQIAMIRVHYRRRPEPLPEASDLPGLARYWKHHYNTNQGKGTEEEFEANFKQIIGEPS